MKRKRTSGRCRGFRPGDAMNGTVGPDLAQLVAHPRPAPHVFRFLLDPDQRSISFSTLEGFSDLFRGEGIELFETDDRGVGLTGVALVHEGQADRACAQKNSLCGRYVAITEDRLKLAFTEIFQGAGE